MSCPSPVPMKKTIQALCLTASTEVMCFCQKRTLTGLRSFRCTTQTPSNTLMSNTPTYTHHVTFVETTRSGNLFIGS